MAERIAKISEKIEELLDILPPDGMRDVDRRGRSSKKLRKLAEESAAALAKLAEELDPVRRPSFVFDVSNPETIGRLIGQSLLEQPKLPLAELSKFYGSGVYALYYRGKFAAYRPIRGSETPIYVGKADPPTPDAKTYLEQGPKLAIRLLEHAKSIRSATSTLNINDFDCRYLVVQSGWQRSAEDYLLNVFRPIWNSKVCYGFGKHGDDPSTRSNTRSPWDTLHPGRPWATKAGNKPQTQTIDQLLEQVSEHFSRYRPKH
ncbi:MAG: Eco29kI family restriction endonuclease [Planctomycetales bacterium]|nr:Eco29kI family restriction endonuclease [Planctomycetales bacterium]MBN8628905.1 Eco29kI family restriction endonuclease [Planctomycetota bacterium]